MWIQFRELTQSAKNTIWIIKKSLKKNYKKNQYITRELSSPPRKGPDRREAARPGREEQDGFQPSMLTFKAFLQTQDDSITDEESLEKYGEYKLEFQRQQLNEFFVVHKGELL